MSRELKLENVLKTGARFTATDKLGRKYVYEVMGIDLENLLCGTGCAYIVLINITNNWLTKVEAEWFRQRKIENINHWRNIIEVPCTAGTLCAEAGGDLDYPEIFTYLRRKDGEEIDICAVDADGVIPEGVSVEEYDGQKRFNEGVRAVLYADTSQDDWTDEHIFSKEELNIAIDYEEDENE